LKDAGYTVVATYAGNDEAAQKFAADTGIAVYKFDVGNYEVCQAEVAKIESEVGPVEAPCTR
jgi:acetoacetyl-CoA reductase